MKQQHGIVFGGGASPPGKGTVNADRSTFTPPDVVIRAVRAWLVAALGACLATSNVSADIVFDPTADFSVENGNPNGVWSYGWMPGDFSGFGAYAVVWAFGDVCWWDGGEPVVWRNEGPPSGGVPTGSLSLHPGPGGEAAVVRWTAPSVGTARIQGRFLAGNVGTMQVAVRAGGRFLWQGVDSGEFDLDVTVGPGETIDFAVYGAYFSGATPLETVISLTTTSTEIVFDPTSEWSIANGNPNGVWSYGWMPTDFSRFTLFATTRDERRIGWRREPDHCCPALNKLLGAVDYEPSGWLGLHPGPGGEASVLRWTAPTSGPVRIQGQFLAGNWGIVRVGVRVAGQAVWEAEDSGEFDLIEGVSIGDTVDFAVFGGYTAGETPLGVTITLVTDQPAIIASQPTGRNLYVGESARLKVAAYGSGSLSYQWQKDAVDLAGATNTTLVLSNVTEAATGDYLVLVSNAFGTTTSAVARLVVTVFSPDDLADGLVADWPFDEGEGTLIADRSGQGNHGTLQRANAATWTQGRMGSALFLDGNSAAYVAIPSSPSLQLRDALTFAAWVRCDDTERDAPILAKEGGRGASYWFGCFPPGKFGALLGSGGGWDCDDRDNGYVSCAQWVHLASVWDGKVTKHYQDGQLVAEGASFKGPVWAADTPITIGVNSEWDFTRFKGVIDELRVYGRPLSAFEIKALSEWHLGPTRASYVRATLDKKGAWAPPGDALVRSVSLAGTRALLVLGDTQVALVDLNEPATPVFLGSWTSLLPVSDAQLAGDFAYVASYEPDFLSTVEIVDFSAPARPVLKGFYDTPGYAQEITVIGTTAYVADDEAGLLILDVSDPSKPRRLGGYDTHGHVGHVQVAEARAYLADGHWLVILDVSDPGQPRRTGLYQGAGAIGPLQVCGATAYALETDFGLRVLDVADPAHVTCRATQPTCSMEMRGLTASGPRAYLARGLGGLQVLDVANPAAPIALTTAGIGQSVLDVAVMSRFAVVAAGENGLQVFELSEAIWPPLNPPVVANGMVTFAWPALEGVRLQRTASLDPPDWQDVAGSDLTNTVNLPVIEATGFFRLAQ